MRSLLSMPCLRRASVLTAALGLAAGVTQAQSAASSNSSGVSSYSSSQAGQPQTEMAALAAPAPVFSGGAAAGQYGSSGGGQHYGFLHNRKWTFEAGFGFNGPIGSDTGDAANPVPVITWGGNITGGAGLRLNKRLSLLAEYQFIDDKLPGQFLSEFANLGVSAGNTHINSIVGSPVLDLMPKHSNGIYLVGGFGWYHKSTNFQTPQPTYGYYGYYYQNITIGSFTSNQWGANGGLGLYHKLGDMYGGDSHIELFAEARYTYIHTPPVTQVNGLGITEVIPVTFGVRF